MNPEDIIEYSITKDYGFYLTEEHINHSYYISAAFDVVVDNQPLTIIFKRGIIKLTGVYNYEDFDKILNNINEIYLSLSVIFEKITDNDKTIKIYD